MELYSISLLSNILRRFFFYSAQETFLTKNGQRVTNAYTNCSSLDCEVLTDFTKLKLVTSSVGQNVFTPYPLKSSTRITLFNSKALWRAAFLIKLIYQKRFRAHCPSFIHDYKYRREQVWKSLHNNVKLLTPRTRVRKVICGCIGHINKMVFLAFHLHL